MPMQNILNLAGAWEFRRVGTAKWMRATVPGSNFSDLQKLGAIPDPKVADNELKVQWVVESAWEYRKTFNAGPGLLARDRVVLALDGLDTIAEILLNGRKVSRVDNMFRSWRFDVKGILRAGRNELLVRFDSPTSRAGWKKRQPGVSWPGDMSLPGGPFVRKAPCHYGWDWGPKLPPSGIWRGVRVEGRDGARITEVHPRQVHGKRGVSLRVRVAVESWRQGPLWAVVFLTAPCGRVRKAVVPVKGGSGVAVFRIGSPALWWPNGYGEQHLYRLDTSLRDGTGAVADSDTRRIGIRRLELVRKKDRWGESFTFVVNGVPIFAKGANWIPADSFPERVSSNRYRHLLESARDAHMNMVRVWGGGFYENDIFYDLCDELGLLVWQDFMFACSQYPGDKKFIENVRDEAVENIRRLRHRPSLALWCGNNEMESGMAEWWGKPLASSRRAYEDLFHRLLPACVAGGDPDTAYWPSSPSSGNRAIKPGAETHGDVHDWSVWHGRKPFTVYREHIPRFASEFGFQSLPEPATLNPYLPRGERNMSSYLMDHRQRSGAGNEIITHFLSANFRMPADFPSLCYSTQLLQAEAMRYGIEHWRRNRARVSGAIYWQLDDCWPCPSWSSIDYDGRWKALHYLAKRFFAPVLLSACEEGSRVRLHVTNDTASQFRGRMSWALVEMGGRRLAGGVKPVSARALSDTQVADLHLDGQIAAAGARRVAVVFSLHDAKNRRVSGGAVFFAPSKHLELANPRISVRVKARGGRWEVAARAESLARFVEFRAGGAPRVWDDNYFDLPAGAGRTVSCPCLPGEDLASFRRRLRVRSLWNAGGLR
jgi:beta-mannosidase